jgi:hypothetical protein
MGDVAADARHGGVVLDTLGKLADSGFRVLVWCPVCWKSLWVDLASLVAERGPDCMGEAIPCPECQRMTADILILPHLSEGRHTASRADSNEEKLKVARRNRLVPRSQRFGTPKPRDDGPRRVWLRVNPEPTLDQRRNKQKFTLVPLHTTKLATGN